MPLTDEQCLALYESGVARHAIDRAVLLASTIGGGIDWADAPLGERDARLIALRCAWFGPRFDALLACPACRQVLSLSLDLRTLPAAASDERPIDVPALGRRFRRPTARDLAAIADAADVDTAALRLLARLALDEPPAGGWQPEHLAAVEAALDAADPLAHVSIALRCEDCGHGWQAPLDIGASLWDELAAQAQEIVGQVHTLASAYGWSERDILAMPPARRQLYLQRVLA